MANRINFCGDSWCADTVTPYSWCVQLANRLDAEIVGSGLNGSAHEHAIQTFDPTAEFTVFCWTHCDRLYHPERPIKFGSSERSQRQAAVEQYYKWLHSHEYAKERQRRDFYWFERTHLSTYKGSILHIWCFDNLYDWTTGHVYPHRLFPFYDKSDDQAVNHMDERTNLSVAKSIYNSWRL